MGLLQKAIETYDSMCDLAGVEQEGKETLAPIGFISTKAQIEITIDREGKFIQARETDQKIILPATEESSGRTSTPAAHALCDQLCYIGNFDSEKNVLFMNQLEAWTKSAYSQPMVEAVYRYLKKDTVMEDLSKAELIKIDDDGSIKNSKAMICWRVVGIDCTNSAVWLNRDVHSAFRSFYEEMQRDKVKTVCMATGEIAVPAVQHLKGVFSLNGNAKIISANDNANFTYRGRFVDAAEAMTISYEASQKAHNALKWLVANQGTIKGGRAFLCWNPHGIVIPGIMDPILGKLDDRLEPSDYKRELSRTLDGFRTKLKVGESVVIASFDAATTGRLAVTYYNELTGSDFLDRISYWDETCSWYDTRWGTSSPTLYSIVNTAFGTQRGSDEKAKIETDDRIISQHVQRLLACRVDRSAFPSDIMRAAVRKAGNLQVYNRNNRNNMLFNTCAIVRKYRIDRYGEEWNMALESKRKDRSYQYGRLLAIMEKIESDTYDKSETRETNAIRMQSVFVQRPGYAAKIVMDQLKNAYYPRLKPGQRIFYDRLIGEVMEMISEFDMSEFNQPLSETYLMGYYLQKNALYTKKTSEEDNTNVAAE